MSKLSYKTLFTIFFFLLIGVIVLSKFVLPNQKVSAAWWNDMWQYRRAIFIGNSGVAQTNTQIKILDNYDLGALVTAGKIQADLDDLRFTDSGGNLLSYWIEDATNNSVDIWGIISSLPASGSTIYMYYGNSSAISASSTSNITIGGTMTSVGGYRIHTFKGNGVLTNAKAENAEVLVVAGGGGGGSANGAGDGGAGGGGAGGLVYNASYSLTQGQIINVTVGIGGTNGTTSSRQSGTDGGSSIFSTITANGGGGGGPTGGNGRSGGSGGGGGYNGYSTIKYGGSGVVGIGNSGGNTSNLSYAGGAGGGGGAGVGGNNKVSHEGGDGGLGVSYSIIGTGVTYAIGGRGGGGAAPIVKTINTGNGGDGSYSTGTPTSGASGIVVVRYLSGASATPAAEETGTGPVAYWKFDEGTGNTVYDSSSRGHHGTLQNGTSWANEDQCVSGKCLKFDGVNDYVSAGVGNDYLPMNTFSMCAWVKSPGLASGMTLNGIMSYTYGLTMYIDSSGNFVSRVDDGSNIIASIETSQNLYDNKFHHLCFTFDGTNRRMYINGILKKTVATTWNNRYYANTVNIGHENNNSAVYKFNGFIDEPKIYAYARTAAQIKLDYNAGKAHASSIDGTSTSIGSNKNNNSLSDGLIGYWKMDEGVGTTTLDSSGNSNIGTLNNSGWANGKYGIGTSYNGTNGYVSTSSTNFLPLIGNPYSIGFWIQDDTVASTLNSSFHRIISFANGTTNIQIGLANDVAPAGNRIFYILEGSSTVKVVTGPVSTGWHHVVTTSNGSGSYHIYLDGNLADNGNTTSSGASNTTTNSGLLYMGFSGGFGYVNGSLDEVRIYNRALSPTEVSDLYNYAPGPIAYYNFEEGSGNTVLDKSGLGNTGTWSGAGSHWTQGKIGSAGNFNGSDNSIILKNEPFIANNANYTIGFWAKSNSLPINTYARYISWGAAGGRYFIGYNFTSQKIDVGHGNITITPSSASYKPIINTWEYLTFTNENTITKFYKNGILVNTETHADTGAILTGYPVRIGRQYDANTEYFNGSLDDVKIYNYARTQKQIIEDMGNGAPATSAKSIVAYYKFDEGGGTIVNNSGIGGSILNGTFIGATYPTWSNNGKTNKALMFDGITNTLSVSHNSNLNIGTGSYSVFSWVKLSASTGAHDIIVDKGAANINDGGFWWGMATDGKQDANINIGTSFLFSNQTSNSRIDDNKWHRVGFTWDPTIGLKFWLDGKVDGSVNITTTANIQGTSSLYIGGYSNFSGFSSNGLIDEVKIYNYALTSDEIKQDYNQGSALQMGQTSQTIGATTTSLEYCIPGDTTYCASPVAEWNFEENTGTTTKDISGNNNTGTINGATWTLGAKNKGAGLRFSENNYLDTSDFSWANTDSFSLSLWIKPNSLPAQSGILGKISPNWEWTLFTTNGVLNFNYYTTAGAYGLNITTSSILSVNNWYHIMVTYNGNQGYIYVNGVQQGSAAGSGTWQNRATNTLIGRSYSPSGSNYFFDGSIDNVKIYNYARTPAQIAYDYNKGAPIGWWKFDECQGNIANDSSGIGNTGVISIGSSGTQNSLGTCQIGTSAAWTSGASGKINSSIKLDGVDDWINMGDPTNGSLDFGTNSFSYGLWVYVPVSAGAYDMPIYKGGSSNGNPGYDFELGTGGWVANVSDSDTTTITVNFGNEILNQWVHLMAVVDKENNLFKGYKNGIFIASTPLTNLDSVSSSNSLYIGQNSYKFSGQIDDVRIYNYALTAEQVKVLYNGGSTSFN